MYLYLDDGRVHVTRDAGGNFLENVSATWTLQNRTGGVAVGVVFALRKSKPATDPAPDAPVVKKRTHDPEQRDRLVCVREDHTAKDREAVNTIVAQGCRPIGDPLVVTKGLGNVVLEATRLASAHAELTRRSTIDPTLDLPTLRMIDDAMPATPTPTAIDGGFEQLGWSIDLARFGDGWVAARRAQAPAVLVRARGDPS